MYKLARKVLLLSLCIIVSFVVAGQSIPNCDSIYSSTERLPKYPDGNIGLHKYLDNDIIPVLTECYSRDSILVTRIHMKLTIDKIGNVAEVDILKMHASDWCVEKVKNKLLTMTGWQPAVINGEKVCCEFYWPINCIVWK